LPQFLKERRALQQFRGAAIGNASIGHEDHAVEARKEIQPVYRGKDAGVRKCARQAGEYTRFGKPGIQSFTNWEEASSALEATLRRRLPYA